MNHEDEAPLRRSRGRPKGQASREVVERLLDSTEELMRVQSHSMLSERTIAAAAGVNDRMIHYYFGSKDGLIFAVISRHRDEISRSLQILSDLPENITNPTRYMIKSLVAAYFGKPWIIRAGASELSKTVSPIKDLLISKYGTSAYTSIEIRSFLTKMRDRGTYDSDTKIDFVAKTIMSIIAGVYSVPSMAISSTIDIEQLENNEWVNYLADLFDRQLRPGIYIL